LFLNSARSKAGVPGFDGVTGFRLVHQVGWVNPYFKKNSKRRRFSKKKVIGLQPGF
jgi:hypothetical protein